MDYINHVLRAADKGEAGELALASRTLTAQAMTLDAMFTELARRAALNMDEYLDASERYARLASKAQANSCATLEALAKLHQPREQTVRHVHVNDGGQAVVAGQFHHHTGARRMPKRANNALQPERLAEAPRCLAKTRKGAKCQSPAVTGRKRCRMHGGTNPGAPKGNRNAWKHGARSTEAKSTARFLREIQRLVRFGGD